MSTPQNAELNGKNNSPVLVQGFIGSKELAAVLENFFPSPASGVPTYMIRQLLSARLQEIDNAVEAYAVKDGVGSDPKELRLQKVLDSTSPRHAANKEIGEDIFSFARRAERFEQRAAARLADAQNNQRLVEMGDNWGKQSIKERLFLEFSSAVANADAKGSIRQSISQVRFNSFLANVIDAFDRYVEKETNGVVRAGNVPSSFLEKPAEVQI